MENLITKITDKDFGLKFCDMEKPQLGKIAIFNKANKHEYKLPGGGIEENENPEDAFYREVAEETGCKVEIIKYLGVTEEYKYKNNFKQISYIYVSKVIEDTQKLNLTQKEKYEGAKLLWVEPIEALELIQNCINDLKDSQYEDVYATKFVVLRDRRILEYYLDI